MMVQPVNIAIVSTACRFPDADNSAQLWANVIEGRRSFRAVPRERLDLARYAAAAIGEADSITPIRAALLTNWQPDANRLRIPGKAFAAADLTHWLALDIAADAFAAIGGVERLDRTRAAVVVANTLTGEFSRAALLRLRLPFLDDVLGEAASRDGIDGDMLRRLRENFTASLRRHFPEPNEDSLAGGLANTIAGRIANHFDLGGGAYSVDGACASSLVALADAGNLITTGQADAVLVAAVDLSLDPFEMIGFSRNGALASGEMRVFDARSNGFWPGEGGGAVLLMRGDEAARLDLPALAQLRGWGISSDGAGGLTRPSRDGQNAAYRRAYAMAAIDPADIAFVEAHGTGTQIGDPTEVRALASLREGARRALPIGSIKANIGHTKAAAGLAGLIKTVEALKAGMVPPHVGCDTPHDVFAEVDGRIHPALTGEEIARAIAGVSSFGFGGINAHVVLAGAAPSPARAAAPARPLRQDAELFIFAGTDAADVTHALTQLKARAPGLSMAELTDAAAYASETSTPGPLRVALIAASGEQLDAQLERAKAALAQSETVNDAERGIFVDHAVATPRIAFLFPGQAAPSRPDGGAWARRFDSRDLLERIPSGDNAVATQTAQPTITAASLAALRVLDRFGIKADIAAGHSLGEIAALAWAGALDETQALDLAAQRGTLMAQHALPGGTMLRVALAIDDAQSLTAEHSAALACHNGDHECVLSGSREAIDAIAAVCRARGIEATKLSVSHAFHSADMTPAAAPWRDALAAHAVAAPERRVVSTVSGAPLGEDADIKDLLVHQLTAPVQFAAALDVIAGEADIVIEAGPGQGLTRLARLRGLPAFSVDAFGMTMTPILTAVAAMFAAGTNPDFSALYSDRHVRPFDPADVPTFLASPCAPLDAAPSITIAPPPPDAAEPIFSTDDVPLTAVRRAIIEETQFAANAFDDADRFLDDLHLNSLSVARIVTHAARSMAIEPPKAPTEFANATARQLADALSEMKALGPRHAQPQDAIAGVRPWLRRYAMQWREDAAPPGDAGWTIVNLGETAAIDNERLLLWLPDADSIDVEHLVAQCQAFWRNSIVRHLAICHDGLPLDAFARSLALEQRFNSVQVIERAAGQGATDILPHLHSGDGYHAGLVTLDNRRLVPRFLPLIEPADIAQPFDASDVVAVTGGSSGIGAECALRLAALTGAAIALIGRRPADDEAVRAVLARAKQSGLRCVYRAADVTDAAALDEAFASIARELGPITALLHAAGRNEPQTFEHLTAAELRATLAPKVDGLRNALRLAPSLRRVIVFGSIIGRLGLEGEAHYALANALAADIVARWAAERDGARGLTIEWSAWRGLGMGERLGTIERLAQRGVAALSVDDALDEFERLIRDDADGTIALCDRFGDSRHATSEAAMLPSLRFVGTPLVYYPHCELITETTLSPGRDLYLGDHRVDGGMVFPGVMALEAMAQVAAALAGCGTIAAIEDIGFDNAITLAEHEPLTIRIAALLREDGRVETVIRAADDSFASVRMRATFTLSPLPAPPRSMPVEASDLVPAGALYGSLLFQSGRFRAIAAYRHIAARRIVARLSPGAAPWFSAYETPDLLLGDPALHDAMLHALQAAVPNQRVLPVSIERIQRFAGGAPVMVEGRERSATDKEFTFDIEACDVKGCCVERWSGVTFRAIGPLDAAQAMAAVPHLSAPYLERLARAAFRDHTIEAAIIADASATRAERRSRALTALGLNNVARRHDGKPLAADGSGLSIAHHGGVTLAVRADGGIACDLAAADDFAGPDDADRWCAQEIARKLSAPAAARTASWWINIGGVSLIAAIGIARPQRQRGARLLAAAPVLETGAAP